MRHSSKDRNHDAVVRRFRELGCTVAELHDCGLAGWPDVVVGVVGRNELVEIKNPETAYGRKGLNRNQSAFARDWRGGPVYVCTGPASAVDLVQLWRRRRAS